MLKEVLNSYRRCHPEYDAFVCNFVNNHANEEDEDLFHELVRIFKNQHRLSNMPAFLSDFVERHEDSYKEDVTCWYKLIEVYREYFIEWLEYNLEQEEK